MKAFGAVLHYIEAKVIEEKQVTQLSTLQNVYKEELISLGCPNTDYRNEKLKARLENHEIFDSIAFTKFTPGDKGCLRYNLVYSAQMSTENAISHAYQLAYRNTKDEMGQSLRKTVLQSYQNAKEIPWPPTADDLDPMASNILPPDIIAFLTVLITGSKEQPKNDHIERVILSIGQVGKA